MPTGLFRRAARPLDDLFECLAAEPAPWSDWHEMPARLEWEA
jgi:hypothetical protein